VTKIAFYHLRNIANVRLFLSQADTERLIHITSRLDYSNGLLSAQPQKAISQLQNIQNATARVLAKNRRRAHITPVLMSLQWLPVSFRIYLKILLLVFKSMHAHASQYTSGLLLNYVPSRT
jgi:hypothetical protein